MPFESPILTPVRRSAPRPDGRAGCAQKLKNAPYWIGLLLGLLGGETMVAQSATNELLTTAASVLALPGDVAWGKPVTIRGVVTAAEPDTAVRPDWDKKFFVQDATAGVFAEDNNQNHPAPGDLVEVTGTSHPGGFAPFISYASWKKLGTAPLPEAKPVDIEQLMAGIEDSQRIEITGIIRIAQKEDPVVKYEIVSGGYRLTVYAPPLKDTVLETLIGARVRVRGTASTFYSGQLRQLIRAELHVPFASDFSLERTQTGDLFNAPLLALNSLGQFKRNRDLGERVHVRGVVTCQRPGEDLFIQDATSGMQIKSSQTNLLTPGEVVDVIGFPGFDHFLPVLEDATFRAAAEPRQTLKPAAAVIKELQGGFRHASLITLQGRVLNRNQPASEEGDGTQNQPRAALTLQNDGMVFTVEGFSPEVNQGLAQIPIGSKVEVAGVCFMRIAESGSLQSLQVFLPRANDIRILQKPDWLTPVRLLGGLTILFTILLVALTWTVMVQRRNKALKRLVGEKTKAQQELQESHELLEWRVAERTRQLKFEMGARKEAEVQFKATLAERTRLARDLHDTLEQVLTGIGLQVDTAAELVDTEPVASKRHMRLVRSLMADTQLELRRSIWDLRSRELEQFDFPGALRVNAQHIIEGTNLKFEMETSGGVRPLSEVTEENLLRISQAAVTNVVKHAAATELKISLHYGEGEVRLRISDNGHGFDPVNCTGASEGHFGLLGISERVKRLDGHFQITSQTGGGTCLEAQVPVRPEPGNNAKPETRA